MIGPVGGAYIPRIFKKKLEKVSTAYFLVLGSRQRERWELIFR
jgi:hypothetical protein